ncbi:hypothetical protein EP7_001338 [Isosphaeraceae bacterium EP7]
MKRWFQRSMSAAWRKTGPLRHPVQAKASGFFSKCMLNALETQAAARTPSNETNLVLDSLLNEVFRLQMQVEVLQQLVAEQGDRLDDAASFRRESDAA